MGKYIRKCKGIGEIAVMEVAQIGVRTRARSLAMAAANEASRKRRKISSGDLHLCSSYIQLGSSRQVLISQKKQISPATTVNSGRVIPADPCSSSSSDHFRVSRCSSNGSSVRERRSVDLEGKNVEIENSTYSNCWRRERTPSSEFGAESDELESTARPSEANSRHRTMAEKTPLEAEIEEFFCAAEKDEQKRFAEKYNYDIVKDVPLEGRYEWVPMKKKRSNEEEWEKKMENQTA